MSTLGTPPRSLAAEHGFTMVELLVAMSLTVVISLAAFGFLQFATSDVSRITERVHAAQTGRVTMEKLTLQLHSACVTPSVTPILTGSSENVLEFISEGGAESALSTVHKHEIIYTPALGTLVEKTYVNTGKTAPKYVFSKTAATTTTLLTGVTQSENGKTTKPIFQYYRYYQEGDTPPIGDATPPYGELNPTPVTAKALTSEEEVANVAKVTISFTVAPKSKETATFNRDRPIPLEDSVVFRLSPSSEASSNHNLPCSPQT